MIMKRFLVTNLMAMAFFIQGWSCVGEYSTHNYYMMDVAPRNVNLLNLEERFNQYWKNYTGYGHDGLSDPSEQLPRYFPPVG